MLRLASALARFITKDPKSPTTSTPGSPAPRKQSFKTKPSWRSASVHTDGRANAYRCPFTATNALTAATKKEIDAYNSSEEIPHNIAKSSDRINDSKERHINGINFKRRSLAITLEDLSLRETESGEAEVSEIEKTCEKDKVVEVEVKTKSPDDSSPSTASGATSPDSECSKRSSMVKPSIRKTSCTVALDVYRRRGSGAPARQRLNSISLISEEKLSSMREKFGTPEKVMHFFGRCFVKFFSNYGLVYSYYSNAS